MVQKINNLRIDMAKTEEDAAERLEAVLEMEFSVDGEGEGEEGGVGTQMTLVALEFLTQDAEPSGTSLVHARNGSNELSCLEML